MDNSIPIQKTKVFRVKTSLDKGTAFEEQCKKENTNINAKLNYLIESSLRGQKRYFFSGKNIINYNKLHNNFSWLVQLDSGKEIEILKDLSDEFLKNLKKEIEKALQERNDWVHNRQSDSVGIPRELIGGENGN